MKTLFLTVLLTLQSAMAITPKEFVDSMEIRSFGLEMNKFVSETMDSKFAAASYKAFIEKNKRNKEFSLYMRSVLSKKAKKLSYPKNMKIIVNMGLGWDAENYAIQMPHVKSFIDDVKTLGPEVIFLNKYPYGPIEQNIESIKPQLKGLLRDEKSQYVLLSLCKGTPEILVAAAELVKENPNFKKRIAGFINLSGMMAGTFFSSQRLDIQTIVEIEKTIDSLPTKNTFSKYDRQKTVWSLPFVSVKSVAKNIRPVLNTSFDDIPAVNVSGAIMNDRIEKRDTPLKMFILYNKIMSLYPYGNDGFIDVTQTHLPKSMFRNQKSMVINSSHLLVDGYLDEYDLMDIKNRHLFYRGIFQSLLLEIK